MSILFNHFFSRVRVFEYWVNFSDFQFQIVECEDSSFITSEYIKQQQLILAVEVALVFFFKPENITSISLDFTNQLDCLVFLESSYIL